MTAMPLESHDEALEYSSAAPSDEPEVIRARLDTWRTALPFEDAYHRQLLSDAIDAVPSGREVYVVPVANLARLTRFTKEADAAYAVRYANDHPEWAINLHVR